MTAETVAQIVLACIVSAGGIGGIIICVIKFSANRIADALSLKYQASLDKELETYKKSLQEELEKQKTGLNKKEYISKTRFDTEFQIYRDISIAFFDLVRAINMLIPNGYAKVPASEEARKKQENENLSEALKKAENAQDVLNRNAPFIPEKFYDLYDSLLRKCIIQTDVIMEKFNILNLDPEKGTPNTEDYLRTGEINEEFKANNNTIREYLASLDVIE